MPRRFGAREPHAHNETLVSTHPTQGEGDPKHGIPEYPDALPGTHDYPARENVDPVELAVPPHKAYYAGGQAHGVARHSVKAPGSPVHDFYRTEDEEFHLPGPWRGEPVPVTITDHGKLVKASFRQVSLNPGADPIVIVPRNDQREAAYLLNETVSFVGRSLSSVGSVTNPGAGAQIAGVNNLPPGTYTVSITVFLSGTVTSADANNLQTTGGGSSNTTIAYPGVANVPVTVTLTFVTTGTGNITVKTIGAASGASAVYNAMMTVTQVAAGGVGAGVRLRNGPTSDIGSLLPASQSRYFMVKTQDVVYAQLDSSASAEQLVSVIETYTVRT